MFKLILVFLVLFICFVMVLFYFVYLGHSKHLQIKENKYNQYIDAVKASTRWKEFMNIHNIYYDLLKPLTMREFFFDNVDDLDRVLKSIVKEYGYTREYLNDIETKRMQLYIKYNDDIEKNVLDAHFDDSYTIDEKYKEVFHDCLSKIVVPNQSLFICINYPIQKTFKIEIVTKTFTNSDIINAIKSNEKEDEIKKSIGFNTDDYRYKIQPVSQDVLYKHEFEKQQRDKMSPSLRYNIMKRDNFKCCLCGKSAEDGIKLEVDHIIPVSKGGESIESNLQTLCQDCNRGKSNSRDE